MPLIADRVLDLGLTILTSEANRLDICSAEPATYAEATATLSLGHKTAPTIGSPAARTPDGRRVVVSAFTDGTVTDDGTATHYAITDTVNERLLVAQALAPASVQAVTDGNTFSLAAFDVGIAGPV